MPFHIALYEPEIPPNTGNIIRLCANLGGSLHLIEPLGFKIDDAKLRRAGLDYTDWEKIHFYSDWAHFISMMQGTRIFACTTKAKQLYTEPRYQSDDVFLFGPETRGLPSSVIETFDANRQLRIPMQPNNRSLNLSNAVAVIAYEAWRQQGFMGPALS